MQNTHDHVNIITGQSFCNGFVTHLILHFRVKRASSYKFFFYPEINIMLQISRHYLPLKKTCNSISFLHRDHNYQFDLQCYHKHHCQKNILETNHDLGYTVMKMLRHFLPNLPSTTAKQFSAFYLWKCGRRQHHAKTPQ